MKTRPVATTLSRKTADTLSPQPSTGQEGIALAPPAYGIDLADRGANGSAPVQRLRVDEEPSQPQRDTASPSGAGALPDRLKAGLESLSGLSMDHVKVHYQSPQPARLQALAFAQGTDIHVAPGQERHLPHEAWHVVQQAQGRVRPTVPMHGGVAISDDRGLEREADAMGARALAGTAERLATPAHTAGCGCVACAGGRAPRAEAQRAADPRAAQAAGPVFQLKCKICEATSHSTSKCPKNENKTKVEKSGRGLTKAGKNEKAWLEHLLTHKNWDPSMMYGKGGKSIIGGYNGKPSGLDVKSIRIDRQSEGNVQFQVGDYSYACALFEQDDDPNQIMAALRRSIQSGQNETVG